MKKRQAWAREALSSIFLQIPDESSEGNAVPRTPVVSLGNEFIPLSWNAEVPWERKGAFPCPVKGENTSVNVEWR